MKQKRIFAFTLVLALLIGMFAIIPSAGAAENGPVKLIYAKPEYASSEISAVGYVEVENIAYHKNVTIHYSYDGVDWFDCAAEYYKPTWGNYEAWKFETPSTPVPYRDTVTIKFAIKYEVNGQTYWDNNNGEDYSVAAGYGITNRFDFGVGGIANFYAARYEDGINGYLELDNLGDQKVVEVIYTTDDWGTSNKVEATYVNSFEENPSIELWKYVIPSTESTVQYKLSYTVNGITYVDDNFGNYYTV